MESGRLYGVACLLHGYGLCQIAWRRTATNGRGFMGERRLLHRHALGEIARLIHVLASDYRGVVGEQL